VKHLIARFYGISPLEVDNITDVEIQALLLLINEDLKREREAWKNVNVNKNRL